MAKLKSDKQERFCAEYVVDANATQAAIRAGYSHKTAGSQGHDLLKKPEIQARIAEMQAKIADKLEISASSIAQRYLEIASADPAEIAQLRRGACRYCWGEDHAYQWRTAREYEAEFAAWQADTPSENALQHLHAAHMAKQPTPEGGFGYRHTERPNPDCPECCGDGFEHVWLADTRCLSPSAKRIYAGAEEGRNGIKVHQVDRIKALEALAAHLGMNKGTLTLNPAGAFADALGQLLNSGSKAPISPDAVPIGQEV